LTLLFGHQPFGNVFVSADPMSSLGDRTIDHQNGASIRGLDDRVVRFSLLDRGDYFGAIFLSVAANAAGGEAMADEVNELNAGFHD
jgi:hypothetical protein